MSEITQRYYGKKAGLGYKPIVKSPVEPKKYGWLKKVLYSTTKKPYNLSHTKKENRS